MDPVPLFNALCSHFSTFPGWGGILVRLPAAVAAGQRHRLHGPPGELQRRSRHNSLLLNILSISKLLFFCPMINKIIDLPVTSAKGNMIF